MDRVSTVRAAFSSVAGPLLHPRLFRLEGCVANTTPLTAPENLDTRGFFVFSTSNGSPSHDLSSCDRERIEHFDRKVSKLMLQTLHDMASHLSGTSKREATKGIM
jgi:hypothetical protein